jgi:hypothetical protein
MHSKTLYKGKERGKGRKGKGREGIGRKGKRREE